MHGQLAGDKTRHEHLHGRRIGHRHQPPRAVRAEAVERFAQPRVFERQVAVHLGQLVVGKHAVVEEHLGHVTVEEPAHERRLGRIRVEASADGHFVDGNLRVGAVALAFERAVDVELRSARADGACHGEHVERAHVVRAGHQVARSDKSHAFGVNRLEPRGGEPPLIERHAGEVVVAPRFVDCRETAKTACVAARRGHDQQREIAGAGFESGQTEIVVLAVEPHDGPLIGHNDAGLRIVRSLHHVAATARRVVPNRQRLAVAQGPKFRRLASAILCRGIKPEVEALRDIELLVGPGFGGAKRRGAKRRDTPCSRGDEHSHDRRR